MKKTTLLARKTISGSVAAALLLGAFAYVPQAKPAFAAEVEKPAPLSPVVANYLNNLVAYTSLVTDKNQDDLRTDISLGKSLTQASGLTGSELANRLIVNFDAYIENSQRGASDEAIQKLKGEGAKAIKNAVANGYEPTKTEANIDFDAVVRQRLQMLVSDVATISNKDYGYINSQYHSGATLVQAAGMPYGDLFGRLVDLMNQQIDGAVGSLAVASDKISKAKADGAQKLAEAITSAREEQSSQQAVSSLSQIVKRELATIVSDAAIIADKDYNDVLDAVQSGQTIPQAVGMSASDLSQRLILQMNQSIDAVGGVDDAAVQQAKSDAAKQINELLSNPEAIQKEAVQAGNVAELVKNRLKLVVLEAASIADKDTNDVQYLFDSGASLAAATGVSGAVLVNELTVSINQYIDSLTNDSEAQAKAKKEAAEQISKWVNYGKKEA